MILSLLLTAFAAQATPTCVPANDLADVRASFQFTPALPPQVCDDRPLVYRTVTAILFLKTTSTTIPESPVEQNIEGQTPYTFFAKRIRHIFFETSSDTGCTTETVHGEQVATVMYEQSPNEMHVCPATAPLTTVETASTLVHEARHTEGYEHSVCTHGYLAKFTNSYACDASFTWKGAYAVEAEYENRLSKMPETDPAMRAYLRASVLNDLVMRFNKMPFQLKLGTIMQTEAGAVGFFDGKALTTIATLEPGDRLMSYSGDSPLIAKASDAKMYTLNLLSGQTTEAGSQILADASATDGERRSLLDSVLSGTDYGCYLLRDGLICHSGETPPTLFRYSFRHLKPAHLFWAKIGSTDARLVLSTEEGVFFDFPKTFMQLQVFDEDKLVKIASPRPLLAYYAGYEGLSTIAIDLTGQAYSVKNSVFTPVLSGEKIVNVIRPVIWSPVLKAL